MSFIWSSQSEAYHTGTSEEPNRRSEERLPAEYSLRYRLLDGSRREGEGVTLNLSSRGLCFIADRSLPAASPIDVRIAWPILRQNRPIELAITGTIVRADQISAAVAIDKRRLRLGSSRVPPGLRRP